MAYNFFLVIAFTFNIGHGDQITSQFSGPYFSMQACREAKVDAKRDVETQGSTVVSFVCVEQPVEGD